MGIVKMFIQAGLEFAPLEWEEPVPGYARAWLELSDLSHVELDHCWEFNHGTPLHFLPHMLQDRRPKMPRALSEINRGVALFCFGVAYVEGAGERAAEAYGDFVDIGQGYAARVVKLKRRTEGSTKGSMGAPRRYADNKLPAGSSRVRDSTPGCEMYSPPLCFFVAPLYTSDCRAGSRAGRIRG